MAFLQIVTFAKKSFVEFSPVSAGAVIFQAYGTHTHKKELVTYSDIHTWGGNKHNSVTDEW